MLSAVLSLVVLAGDPGETVADPLRSRDQWEAASRQRKVDFADAFVSALMVSDARSPAWSVRARNLQDCLWEKDTGWPADLIDEGYARTEIDHGPSQILLNELEQACAAYLTNPILRRTGPNDPGVAFGYMNVMGAFGTPYEDWTFYLRGRLHPGAGDPPREFAIARVNETGATVWADSATCAAVGSAMIEMESIASPSIYVAGSHHTTMPQAPVADGVNYKLEMTGAYWASGPYAGELSFSGNVDSPVAKWAVRTSARLEACWSPYPPRVSEDAREADQ